MPEGPELKLSAEVIKPLVVNKAYVSRAYAHHTGRYASQDPEGLAEFLNSFRSETGNIVVIDKLVTVTDVQVKGKFMYWTFSNGWYLFNTYGMTGQWSPQDSKHICFAFRFREEDKFTHIYFNDPRHFGTIKFTNKRQDLVDKLNSLGWDPLANNLPTYQAWLDDTLSKNYKNIGETLLDQSIFAGVGNYIRAEALYVAKISPFRKCNSLSSSERLALYNAIIDVMEDSYKHQGATISTYKDAYGAEGKYSSQFKVYGQKNDPNGNLIVKEKSTEGRTIHWCPTVQI